MVIKRNQIQEVLDLIFCKRGSTLYLDQAYFVEGRFYHFVLYSKKENNNRMIEPIHQLFVLGTTIFLRSLVEVFILIKDVSIEYSHNRLIYF